MPDVDDARGSTAANYMEDAWNVVRGARLWSAVTDTMLSLSPCELASRNAEASGIDCNGAATSRVSIGRPGHSGRRSGQLCSTHAPRQAGEYVLEFDEEGDGLIRHQAEAQEPRWAKGLLTPQVMRDAESGTLFIVDAEENVVLWADWVAQFTEVNIRYKIPGSGNPSEVRAWVFPKSAAGSHVFWSLPELHKCLGLPGQPSEWNLKHWQQWGERSWRRISTCARRTCVARW